MSNINQQAYEDFTQSLLEHSEAEADRLNMPIQEVILGVVSLAMYLSVDRRRGDVDHGQLDVMVLAKMIGAQMNEWPIEDRLLQEETVN